MSDTSDHHFMSMAMELAKKAAAIGEVPVGAVVVCDGEIIGEGHNCPITAHDPSAHAEVVALRAAAKRMENYRLPHATLYVTMEPCTMCAGLMVHARIERLVYGCTEPKSGAVISNGEIFSQSHLNHLVEVTGGVMAQECSQMVSQFFRQRRAEKKRIS